MLSLNLGIVVVIGLVLHWEGLAQARVLATADFESGPGLGWTVFTTANGTLGGEGFPAFADCDAAVAGQSSRCWQVKVGQVQYSPDQNPQQGGGLETRQEMALGRLHLSASVMVIYRSPKDKRNLAGGLFEWIVDDQVVGLLDIGPIEHGVTVRHQLTAAVSVEAGSHRIQLRISRPFKSGTGQQAPVQLVDNLVLDWLPLDEDSPQAFKGDFFSP